MTAGRILSSLFGPAGSLQRRLTLSMIAVFSLMILLAVVVMIHEFFDHLGEALEEQLAREALEVLIQIDPAAEEHGLDTDSLRFRGPLGAYRYTVFGPDLGVVAGGETSPEIRAQIARVPIGEAAPVALPGERRAMALCGLVLGQRYCVLASTYAPATDDTILNTLWQEVSEQTQWLVMAAITVLASALLVARRTLRPLDRIRREAALIGPRAPERRLSTEMLPSEIVPLVESVNRAFSRLDQGYRAQRDFSANVAHEIRNPLAILRAGIDRIEDAPTRRRLRRDLARIDTTFEQLIHLARAEAIGPESLGPVDLRALAAEVAAERAAEALRAGKSLALVGAETAPVRGHAGLIRIALDNLLRNALTHTPQGSEVEIEVSAAPPALRVADRGPGIPEAERERLFERFRRGTTVTGDGSGLGLAIVRSVAQAHGGTVRIEDRPGGGSILVLEFTEDGKITEDDKS